MITNPSAQSAKHNTSLAQGVGNGLRTGDPSNDVGGGTGLLVDLAGNDRYSCGVFCQGAGYFYGHGILYDSSGDDAYHGVWYVQGSGAHFALGTFLDDSGNDQYQTVIKASRGEGHDQSGGFFLEGGGNDVYSVPSLSNGAGNNAGFGFFVEAGGNDSYTSVDTAEGGRYGQVVIDGDFANYANPDASHSIAVFLELAGDNRYLDPHPEVTNGATWKLPGAVSRRLRVLPCRRATSASARTKNRSAMSLSPSWKLPQEAGLCRSATNS